MRKNPGISSSDAGVGIWYYVWLKPNWVFMHLKDKDASHVALWNSAIHLDVAKHYRIRNKAKIAALKEAYRGMPRGRVVPVGMEYIIAHGDDFPRALHAKDEIARIVSIFGLTGEYLRGAVRGQLEPHETMLPGHQDVVQSIIGTVPY